MPKDNSKNLIPLNQCAKDVQREIQSKGGKARAKKANERKTLKEELTALLEMVDDGESVTNGTRISVSLIQKALLGDVKAFEVIRDTIGEKPTDRVEVKSCEAQAELREYLKELKGGKE